MEDIFGPFFGRFFKSVDLPPRLPELIASVGADMGLTETEKKRAVPFYCDHVEPQVKGSLGAMFGAVLGFPLYMDWSSRVVNGRLTVFCDSSRDCHSSSDANNKSSSHNDSHNES